MWNNYFFLCVIIESFLAALYCQHFLFTSQRNNIFCFYISTCSFSICMVSRWLIQLPSAIFYLTVQYKRKVAYATISKEEERKERFNIGEVLYVYKQNTNGLVPVTCISLLPFTFESGNAIFFNLLHLTHSV